MSDHQTEAATEVFCEKKLFLKVLLNSQENNCARVSFLIKVLLYLRKVLWKPISVSWKASHSQNFLHWNYVVPFNRSSRLDVFCKEGFLRNFAKFTGNQLEKPEACNFIKIETLVQVFSFEFCETSKNSFSYRCLLLIQL